MKIILIAGPSKSGKSEASKQLAKELGEEKTLVIHLDDFYEDLSAIEDIEERAKFNFDEPTAIDTLFLDKVVTAIKNGEKVMAPQHDPVLHTRKQELREIDPTGIEFVILEGIFALHPDLYLEGYADIKVYMDTDERICTARRFKADQALGRSVDTVFEQYVTTVLPMQDQHIVPTKNSAHVWIENNGHDGVIDLGLIHDHLAWLEKNNADVVRKGIDAAIGAVGGRAAVLSNTAYSWFGTFAAGAKQVLATGAKQVLVSAESKLEAYFKYEDQESVAAPGSHQV